MKLFQSKKSELMMGLVIMLMLVLFFAGWLITIGQKECTSDAQCGSGYYCGSDFACHQLPTVEKTIMHNSLVAPAVIIGLAIIIAAIVFRYSPKK